MSNEYLVTVVVDCYPIYIILKPFPIPFIDTACRLHYDLYRLRTISRDHTSLSIKGFDRLCHKIKSLQKL